MDGFSAAAGAFSFAKVVLYCINVLDDYRRLFVTGELGYLVSKCDGPTSTLTSNINAAEEVVRHWSLFYEEDFDYKVFCEDLQRTQVEFKKAAKMFHNEVQSICGKTGSNLPKNLHGLVKLIQMKYHRKLFGIIQGRITDQEASIEDLVRTRHMYTNNRIRRDCMSSPGLPNEVWARHVDISLSANKTIPFVIPRLFSDFYHGGNGYFGDLVQRLNLSSVKGSTHQRKVVYIYGARGLGKTHLCSEFADRHKTWYWGVFWYRFGDERVESLDPSSKVRLISQLSGVQESWLLIMDNASCLAHAESVLPNSDRAHILITTELSPAETANSIHVLDMDHEDKKEFLLWAAGFVKPWCDSDIAWSEDIMKLVGPKAVPRTLSYVGATIRSGSCAPEEYIAMFEKEQILELKGDIQQEPDKLAFDMAVAQIQKQNTRISKDALKLLNISSFFTTRYITLSTLTKSLIIYDTTREEQRRTQSNKRAGTCRITNRFWPSKRSKRNGEVHHMHQVSPGRQLPESPIDRSRTIWASTELVDMWLLQCHSSNRVYSMNATVRNWIKKDLHPSEHEFCQKVAEMAGPCQLEYSEKTPSTASS